MLVLNAFLGLAFVILLLYVISKLIQRFSGTIRPRQSNVDKINITGITYIDDSNKIVCATHGPVKYLFVMGKNGSLLLDKYEYHEK